MWIPAEVCHNLDSNLLSVELESGQVRFIIRNAIRF